MSLIVHFSRTPLAGSPIRVCNALNAHTEFTARSVVHQPGYGPRTYQTDLVWSESGPEIISLAERADLIHLHNELDLDSTLFAPLSFRELHSKGKMFVRQYHTAPQYLAGWGRYVGSPSRSEEELVNYPLPKLVLAQYHERYYPTARLVPNIVPIPASPRTEPEDRGEVRIFFSPTNSNSAWEPHQGIRWGTKGLPETREAIMRLVRRHRSKPGFPRIFLDVCADTPHEECLRRRLMSHISIDEMVSGSYHLSSLESLSMGIPTLAFLDSRVHEVLYEMTQSPRLPWVNVRLEEAEEVLLPLVCDRELRRRLGEESFQWMQRYWNDKAMVQHYVRAYADVMAGRGFEEVPRFDARNLAMQWYVKGADDAAWEARRRINYKLARRIKSRLKKALGRVGGNGK